jgi:hypothetical protein
VGRRAEAQRILAELIARRETAIVPPTSIAQSTRRWATHDAAIEV